MRAERLLQITYLKHLSTVLICLSFSWQLLLPSLFVAYQLYDTGELPTERFCMKRGQFTSAPAPDQPASELADAQVYAAPDGQLPQPGLCFAGPQLPAALMNTSDSPAGYCTRIWPQPTAAHCLSRGLAPDAPVPKV